MVRVNGSTIYAVADVTAPDYPAGTPRYCLADLQLMAAAPELLAALRDLIAQLDVIGVPDWHGAEGLCFNQSGVAIAKAEGRGE